MDSKTVVWTGSPPEWVQRANKRDAPILLEDRLVHFTDWLRQQGVMMVDSGGKHYGPKRIHDLIEEYVNT